MRVAVDVTPLLGRVTGVGQAVQGLLSALPGAAPEIEVARWELTRRSVPIPPRVLVRLWSRMSWPRGDRWLPGADVVHGTNYVVPPSRRPSTVTVNDCWCARSPGSCDPTVRAATATVQRAVDRGAWVHASTEAMAREIRQRYGADRVRVVPYGVPAVADVAPVRRAPYVLALGASDHRKGHDVLRAAMREVPGVELVIAGGTTWVDDDTRAGLLRGAAALAFPSRDEGFGFPVLEAMSVGVPVVATDVGGIPEVAGGAALLVPAEDPGALAAALRRAVGDDAERRRMVNAGHARAARFTWDAHARGMAALWHEALEAA